MQKAPGQNPEMSPKAERATHLAEVLPCSKAPGAIILPSGVVGAIEAGAATPGGLPENSSQRAGGTRNQSGALHLPFGSSSGPRPS